MALGRNYLLNNNETKFDFRYQLFFKEPGLVIQFDGILRPFRIEVWLVLASLLIGAGVILKITHLVGIILGSEDRTLQNEFKNLRIFFVILSAFLQQGTSTFRFFSSNFTNFFGL